jgi:hypothetical protein
VAINVSTFVGSTPIGVVRPILTANDGGRTSPPPTRANGTGDDDDYCHRMVGDEFCVERGGLPYAHPDWGLMHCFKNQQKPAETVNLGFYKIGRFD